MKYFIITGASRGLGEGIAIALLHEQHHLLCVSRRESESLKKMAAAKNCQCEFLPFDLSMSSDIGSLCDLLFNYIDHDTASGVYLVNNAGVIEPVGRVENNKHELVDTHMRINLLSPMAISAAFISAFKSLPVQKRIMNISSGAAKHPYFGWSAYCTSKAGIDMFSRCTALEQADERFPVEVMAVAPGIIDTDMQSILRKKSKNEFVMLEKFIQYKQEGILVAPTLAGKRLAHLLLSDEFRSGEVIDLRN